MHLFFYNRKKIRFSILFENLDFQNFVQNFNEFDYNIKFESLILEKS